MISSFEILYRILADFASNFCKHLTVGKKCYQQLFIFGLADFWLWSAYFRKMGMTFSITIDCKKWFRIWYFLVKKWNILCRFAKMPKKSKKHWKNIHIEKFFKCRITPFAFQENDDFFGTLWFSLQIPLKMVNETTSNFLSNCTSCVLHLRVQQSLKRP